MVFASIGSTPTGGVTDVQIGPWVDRWIGTVF
jgi:hypothetical protein